VNLESRRHSTEKPWTYALLDQRQREIAARIRAGGEGAVLLSEVAPVITLGKRACEKELLLPPEMLRAQGVEVYETDRGGLGTYHGPGQWVLFVVERLDRLTGDPRGVRKAVEGLLEAGLQTGREYRPDAEIRSGVETGVWSKRGKFSAVGVQIDHGILLHGLSLNGFRTETSFLGLRPCGLDAPVDFLIGKQDDEAFERLGAELVAAVGRIFKQTIQVGIDAGLRPTLYTGSLNV